MATKRALPAVTTMPAEQFDQFAATLDRPDDALWLARQAEQPRRFTRTEIPVEPAIRACRVEAGMRLTHTVADGHGGYRPGSPALVVGVHRGVRLVVLVVDIGSAVAPMRFAPQELVELDLHTGAAAFQHAQISDKEVIS